MMMMMIIMIKNPQTTRTCYVWLTDHPDGTSTETTGVVSCLERSSRIVSNGGLGSPLKPKPNMASRTTSYSPAAAGRHRRVRVAHHVASSTATSTKLPLVLSHSKASAFRTKLRNHQRDTRALQQQGDAAGLPP